MDARSRRTIEMGTRALEFSRAHPDESPGYVATLTRLAELLDRTEELATRQRDGTLQVRASTAQKRKLSRSLRRAHLAHVARVARIAAREDPEVAEKLTLRPGTRTYLAFRTAARGMAAEAQSRKEVLVKHGLAESVLVSLAQTLDQFDAAVESGIVGRQTHVAASAELRAVADEIYQIVQVMDGLNRYRFMNDPELLAGWDSASNVLAAPKSSKPGPDTPPTGGEIRPAA